ncbi:MAG: permease [Clostridia bacterium]|nr:permease [Clostridia bacterium]
MEKQKSKNKKIIITFLFLYTSFIIVSLIMRYEPGSRIAYNFQFFSLDMFKLFPPAFILVGLFMVWVDRKVVERYFGEASGIKGYVGAILLSCTTLYPFVVVLPMAASLYRKGAKLSIVLTYLGATAVCRIPMTIFEASFIGIGFSLIRYIVSLPLIVMSSILIERILRKDIIHNRLGINYEGE